MQTNPVKATAEFDINELLEKAGARPRGNRHDCPKCGGYRTVTHSEQVFFCHRCKWKGNLVTLAKELGLYGRLPKAEYFRQRAAQHRIRQQAEALAERVNVRLKALAQAERVLARAETAAHASGPGPGSWEVLAAVYDSRPRVRAEWTLLSYAPALAVVEFFGAAPETREAGLVRIVIRGGVEDDAGRFFELPP